MRSKRRTLPGGADERGRLGPAPPFLPLPGPVDSRPARPSPAGGSGAAIRTRSTPLASTTALRLQTFVQRSIGGVAEGSREEHKERYGPTRNAAMRCRPEAPKTKQCAVGGKETMRCRFAVRETASFALQERREGWSFP